MLTVFRDKRTVFEIEWNGSATFNVQFKGVDVDCFEVYGKAGGALTLPEAHKVAEEHLEKLVATVESLEHGV